MSVCGLPLDCKQVVFGRHGTTTYVYPASYNLFLLIGCEASHDCHYHVPDRIFAPFNSKASGSFWIVVDIELGEAQLHRLFR